MATHRVIDILLSNNTKQAKILAETNFQKFKMQFITGVFSKEHCEIKWMAITFLPRKEKPKEVKVTIKLTFRYSLWTCCKQNINLSDVSTFEPNY